jgi:hypothetical protein
MVGKEVAVMAAGLSNHWPRVLLRSTRAAHRVHWWIDCAPHLREQKEGHRGPQRGIGLALSFEVRALTLQDAQI